MIALPVAMACSRSESDLVEPVNADLAAFPEWVLVNPAQAKGEDLTDLWVRPDGGEVRAVGSRGVILHLVDERWHAETLPITPPAGWSSIAFDREGMRGFAVGGEGWIARYEGGERWSVRREAPGAQLTSVWMDPSGREAFTVGRNGLFLHWTGRGWSPWSLAALPHGVLLDVAATEQELWVRDSVALLAYARREPGVPQRTPRFNASDLWSQDSSARAWIAGVVKPPDRPAPLEDGYSIRGVQPSRVDTVKQIPILPRTAWMSEDRRCGIAAGWATTKGDTAYRSVYVVPTVGSFEWNNPASAHITAVWVGNGCARGWGVGRAGFLARLRLRPLLIRTMSTVGRPLPTLRGRYRLEIDSTPGVPSLDAIRLTDGSTTVPLSRGVHFTVDSVNGRPTTAFRFTFAGRAAAAVFAGKDVRLQFVLSYPLSEPAYPVAYQTDEFTLYRKTPPFKKYGWILGVVGVVLIWGLSFRSSRGVIRSEAGKGLLQSLHFGWIYDLLELVFILSLRVERVRRRVFRAYREEFERMYAPGSVAPLELRVVSCTVLGPAGGGWNVDASRAFETIIQRRDRLLWLQAVPGSRGDELLAQWAALAWAHGHVPVALRLEDESPIDDQIWRALHELGAIKERHQKLWQLGGFVFLLDDSGGSHDETALVNFLQAERGRNFVVLWRDQLRTIGACQVTFAFVP